MHVIKEVINYYIDNKSEVSACTIDVPKAFDHVEFAKLFFKLLLTDLFAHIVPILFA
jgi:hypothetical protein